MEEAERVSLGGREVVMTTGVAPRKVHDDRVLPVVSALEGHGLIDPTRHDEALESSVDEHELVSELEAMS